MLVFAQRAYEQSGPDSRDAENTLAQTPGLLASAFPRAQLLNKSGQHWDHSPGEPASHLAVD